MTKILRTPIAIAVHYEPENPICGDGTTHVMVDDELGGAFIVLKQYPDNKDVQTLRLDLDELEAICQVARELVAAYPEEKD